MSIDVSVIIPALNQERTLGKCIESLLAQDLPREQFEIIIVDNGSTDRTRDVIEAFPVRYAFEPKRSSYTARNRGLSIARGRVVAFMDADCRAEPSWLRSGLRAIDDRRGDLVAGSIRARSAPIPNLYEIYDRFKYLNQRENVSRNGYAATANLFVRRDTIEELSGFDGSMISGGDRDLCLRARDRGLEIAFEPDAVVQHVARSTLRQILRKNERIGFGVFQLLRRRPDLLFKTLPMLAFPLPRRRFLRDVFRRRPPCTRLCAIRLFLLDWLAKQTLVLGCVKAALYDRRRHLPSFEESP